VLINFIYFLFVCLKLIYLYKKSMTIKLKSTQIPKNRITEPYSRPNMVYICDYWKKSGNNFNYDLYLKILEAKSNTI
jgi:hypothetical protein